VVFSRYPNEASFPDVDWLIGNHSDGTKSKSIPLGFVQHLPLVLLTYFGPTELTPWIPYIAARSSYNSKFLILPCCFFDFEGRYRHNDNRIGQYRTYLNFVSEVGRKAGYKMETEV
jgi:tRNASer (uridine44-2'-O)-methyltransferase